MLSALEKNLTFDPPPSCTLKAVRIYDITFDYPVSLVPRANSTLIPTAVSMRQIWLKSRKYILRQTFSTWLLSFLHRPQSY